MDSSQTVGMTTAGRLRKCLLIVWASPYTLLGLVIGCIGLLGGGKGRLRDGVIEFYSGPTRWFVAHLPLTERVVAITLGHVVLGQSAADLVSVGDHERVHVRQFEKWGPAMGPAYLLASAWLWVRGGDAYRGNPFEKEAFAKAPDRT